MDKAAEPKQNIFIILGETIFMVQCYWILYMFMVYVADSRYLMATLLNFCVEQDPLLTSFE